MQRVVPSSTGSTIMRILGPVLEHGWTTIPPLCKVTVSLWLGETIRDAAFGETDNNSKEE